ncbi:CDGSH iron-sulfur domain-containing protein [Melioribacter sp. OK-6-Me]|uniref:CDGSH iron-sulfur domain-containing protein n=1 Tax=unclassified Melioribacter TaxID=2627329 RepID=UPI003EDA06BB
MKIRATENGPYLIEVNDANLKKAGSEEKITQKTIALCRCGASSNKPFCDGSHKKIEFKGEAIEIELT